MSTENETTHKDIVKKILVNANTESIRVLVPFAVSDIKRLSDASPSGKTKEIINNINVTKLTMNNIFTEDCLTLSICMKMLIIQTKEIRNKVSQNRFPVYIKS
jgi:hypothetical protein